MTATGHITRSGVVPQTSAPLCWRKAYRPALSALPRTHSWAFSMPTAAATSGSRPPGTVARFCEVWEAFHAREPFYSRAEFESLEASGELDLSWSGA